MKKNFLSISLLLTIIILAHTSIVANAAGDSGKYNPRHDTQPTVQSFMKSIRANQETGLIDPAWLIGGIDMSQSRDDELNWVSLGPDNYGSLVRAIIYDNKDATNKTIYMGTMGGGIFRTTGETSGITWKLVSDINLMVSCMVQAEDGTIYVGTGDGRGAYNQNGLSDLHYEQSFSGQGIYKSSDGNTYTLIESTDATADEGWAFVNDMAISGNKLYAATNGGLKYSDINGDTWTWTLVSEDSEGNTIEGEAYDVEAGNDGTILAVIGNNIYMSSEEDGFIRITNNDNENLLPETNTYKIIAIAPSDANYMYVSYLTSSNGTDNIYYTNDHGVTWKIALPKSEIHNIYNNRGLLDNAIAVYPNNPKKLLIGGENLWVLEDITNEEIFIPRCISDGNLFQISGFYNYGYIHCGIQSIAFNPDNVNKFFVGSEGGIFKGSYTSVNDYQFEGANRYFITPNTHTSVSRMFSVGFAGEDYKTIGGDLDHGTIHIQGNPNLNNVTTGNAIFPNDLVSTDAAATYGPFSYDKAGGPCAISTIQPDVMFVTATGNTPFKTPLLRTETAGFDYDKSNFSYDVNNIDNPYIENKDVFRTPLVFFENYNDTKSIEKTKFYAKQNYVAGDIIRLRSNNRQYPFYHELTDNLNENDSIEVQDIISSTFIVGVKNSVFMTRDALKFNKKVAWSKIGKIKGIPNAITIDKNGDIAYIGTIDGDLYKISNISNAVEPKLASLDSTDCIIEFDTLMNFNNQAITSIAIDSNNVLVTLGNYGNTDYVFYSTNGGETFTSKQEGLPLIPVYSSIIENSTGKFIIGTENGIYTFNNNQWVKDNGLSNIPVMDLRQQLLANHETEYIYLIDEQNDTTIITYPGISNEGMIYAATYGRGLFNCDTYKTKKNNTGIDENTVVDVLNMSIYPNPIVNNAVINFDLDHSANVSYQIYDLSGRMISNTVLGNYAQGSHQVTFNVDGISAGVYIIHVQAGDSHNTSKILIY